MSNIPLDEYIRVQALDDLGTQEFITVISKLANDIITNPIIQNRHDIDNNAISIFSVQAFLNIFTEVIELVNIAVSRKDATKVELDNEEIRLKDGSVYSDIKTVNTDYMDQTLSDIEDPVNGVLYVINENDNNQMYLYLNNEWISLGIAYTNELWHKKEINKLREKIYEKLLSTIPDETIESLTQSTFNSVIE